MASPMFLILMFLLTPMLLSSSQARDFHVGGKNGWVLKPSQDYNQWAQTNRFQINDTLHFKYNKENDSVLVVKKEDYDLCNTSNPKQKMEGGDSIFKISESGLFFFISGNVDHCKNGQKLIILVMAVKHHTALLSPSAPPSQSPASGLVPPHIHSSDLVTPAPSPSEACVGVSVGFWVAIFMLSGYVGLVY